MIYYMCLSLVGYTYLHDGYYMPHYSGASTCRNL